MLHPVAYLSLWRHTGQMNRHLIVLLNVYGTVHTALVVSAVFETEQVTNLVRKYLARTSE